MKTACCGWAAFLVCVAATTATAQEQSVPPPSLTIEVQGGENVLYVEAATPAGDVVRREVRRSAEPVLPGATGWGPTGRGAFANWTESGERWTVWSRDGGANWSDARSIRTTLRLHDGATHPGQPIPPAVGGLTLPPHGRVFLVQFRTISLPEWRDALAELGGEILAFFPHNGHLLRMEPSLTAAVAALDFVERVEPYHPSYRLEPELRDWLADPSGPTELRVRAVVFEWGPTAKTRLARDAAAAGARVAEYWPDGHVLELWVTREQLRSLSAHDDAMWFDRWGPPETDMNLVRQDSGADWLEANTSPGKCGQGVNGEVMDNGIQQTHQDFDGILMHTSADLQSHGTNTYGIVFGNGARDGDGDATATGHLPCGQGIFADYGAVSNRFAHTQELKNAPYFASFQTNSWGNTRTTQYNSFSQEMDDIIFRLDIAILQSQSNAGNQNSRPQAWAKNIISMGGIRHQNTLSEADDAWNSGASIGPAADGRIKPDLNYWYDNIRTTTTGNGYTSTFGGTSASTPEAAGVIGLLVQQWADNLWNTDPTGNTVFEKQPHAATIKALAINTAKQYTFSGTTADLTRVHQGWGRPNVQKAQQRAATSFVVDEEQALTVGQVQTYAVSVPPGETELKITMIYKDPPGTTSSTLHRINNVDLKVTSPSGTVYHGNVGLDAGNYSTPGGTANSVDTVENVFVQNPQSGNWTIDIEAAEINQDGHLGTPAADVVFALVVTGASGDTGVCGNDVRDGLEDCDGADLGGATCATEGCTGGTLSCVPAGQPNECTFDLSNCTGCPTCDNDGTCGAFEDCGSCPNDCRSGSGAECGNGICEAGDGEDCLSCPADCNGVQSGKPDSRYCCGDGEGINPILCSDPRCGLSGNSCSSAEAPQSCCGDGTCGGDENSLNCEIDCGPPSTCGDGTCAFDEDSCSCPADCGSPPASEVPGSTCTDGIDNDCDGLDDCNDADCSGDPACVCPLGQPGDPCTSDAQCCSNKCKGKTGSRTCR